MKKNFLKSINVFFIDVYNIPTVMIILFSFNAY